MVRASALARLKDSIFVRPYKPTGGNWVWLAKTWGVTPFARVTNYNRAKQLLWLSDYTATKWSWLELLVGGDQRLAGSIPVYRSEIFASTRAEKLSTLQVHKLPQSILARIGVSTVASVLIMWLVKTVILVWPPFSADLTVTDYEVTKSGRMRLPLSLSKVSFGIWCWQDHLKRIFRNSETDS